MINISVLFFGATAEAVGQREIEMNLPENIKAADAFAQITADFPQLKQHKLLFAVNQEYADGGKIVENGDELAVFTAVSGG